MWLHPDFVLRGIGMRRRPVGAGLIGKRIGINGTAIIVVVVPGLLYRLLWLFRLLLLIIIIIIVTALDLYRRLCIRRGIGIRGVIGRIRIPVISIGIPET